MKSERGEERGRRGAERDTHIKKESECERERLTERASERE